MPLINLFSRPALAHWLLTAVALWVLVGLLGSTLSALRGDRASARRGLVAVSLVVVTYLSTLLAVSLMQPARILTPGQSRCFNQVCFSVVGAQELPGFQARDQVRARLLRVTIHLHNTGTTEAKTEPALRAFLVDDHGRRWSIVPGLGGVSLSTRVQPGGVVTSDPVFRLPTDASAFHLELLHTGWYSGRLVIGDPESLLHRSTVMHLPPTDQQPDTQPDTQRHTTNSAR